MCRRRWSVVRIVEARRKAVVTTCRRRRCNRCVIAAATVGFLGAGRSSSRSGSWGCFYVCKFNGKGGPRTKTSRNDNRVETPVRCLDVDGISLFNTIGESDYGIVFDKRENGNEKQW